MSATSQALSDRPQYPIVDLVKYICALLVVSIHISPLSSYTGQASFANYLNYGIGNYVARIAVPFYFAAAGFFLFRKIDLNGFDISIPKNYVFKLLRLLGIWSVLLFVGGKGHLWYLSGLVIAVCFLSILLYKGITLNKLIVIASLLYVIGLLGDPYYGLLRPLQNHKSFDYLIKAYYLVFGTTRNGIFMGFPFLLIGGLIEKKNISMKPFVAFLGFVLSMIALFVEAFLIKTWGLPKDVNMYVFLVPSTFFLLVFSINAQIKQREIFRKLRNVGIIIYFSHLFVYQWILWGWEFVFRVFDVRINNSLLNYLLTITFATILGFFIDWLSKKKMFSFLKYLYS